MTQRLDDVTGDLLPRLSATQREQQREAMIAQINAITLQVNRLTGYIRLHESRLIDVRADLETVRGLLGAFTQRLTFWQRLHWLLRGA